MSKLYKIEAKNLKTNKTLEVVHCDSTQVFIEADRIDAVHGITDEKLSGDWLDKKDGAPALELFIDDCPVTTTVDNNYSPTKMEWTKNNITYRAILYAVIKGAC